MLITRSHIRLPMANGQVEVVKARVVLDRIIRYIIWRDVWGKHLKVIEGITLSIITFVKDEENT
jgi:hypothetical protein